MWIVLCTAAMFALCTPLARFAYDAGAEPMQVIVMRTTATILAGICAAHVTEGGVIRAVTRITKPRLALLAGFFSVVQGVFYVIAVKYIPVGLAAIIFFLWPILVAIFAPRIFDSRWPSTGMMAIFLGAFGGLVIAIGPQWQTLQGTGVLAAFCGAVCFAGFVISLKACLQDNPPTAMIILGIPPSLIPILAYWAWGGFTFLPDQNFAWWGLGLGSLAYVMGILLQLWALKRVKAEDAAILYNLEPVISILFAAALLGERLVWSQYLGGGIIIGMVFLYDWRKHKLAGDA
ncbi:MAG: DMT family transporter [Pseudomonadota bacterium]